VGETISAVYGRLRSAQKGRARGAPAYSIYVNRPLGRVFAALAYRLGMSPNAVTAVSAIWSLTAIVLLVLMPRSPQLGVVVAALLVLGYAWDSSDGQVARLRGGGTLAGEWLDHFVDAVKIAMLHAAVLVASYRADDLPVAWLLVPIGFGIVAEVTFFAMILNDLLKAKRGASSAVVRGGSSPLRSLLLLPTDYGVLCLSFLLWGWAPGFAVVYAALAVANAMFLVLAAGRWFREMTTYD